MKKFITAIIVAIVVTACSQEEISQSILNSDNIIYHASFEDIDIDSRTYLNSSQSLVWHAHDNISMFRSTLNEEYQFTGKTGDSEGDFAKVATDNTSIGSEISTNYAVYPYSAENAIGSDERISLVLPDVQKYAVDSFGQGANTMIATSEDKTSTLLPFRNIGGYIVVKLYSPQALVKSIELRGNNSEILAGRASVQAKYGLYPLVTMDSGTECICLDCGGGVQVGTTAESATQFWFVVPPTSFDKGFTITITDVAGTVTTKTTLKRRVIERNKVMTMSAIEIAKTDADKMLPDYCDINTIDGWTNTRFCKNGMVVFTDNFEGTEVVRKSLMFIPLDNGETISMYAGYDENGSPQYLSFDDIVILIDNYTDTTFNATVVKGNQALWTATNLPLDNFQLDDENNTRAWHENNWVRNTAAIAGIVTSSIGVGIGVALTGTGVGAVAGIASIGFASASLAHNLNVLFGPGESYATNNYIIEKLQEIGQESLVDALAKDSDSYLAKIFKDSEWFDQNYKLPNLFWADLALGLVDKIWGKTVTESQRMQAYALAHRSYFVTTRGVQSLTLHTAELGGYISPEAISPLDQYADVDYGIVVYKADDPSVRQSKLDIIGNGGPFSLLFRGLEANTTYCYFVFYNDKTNYCFRQGETRTFYTEETDLREQLIRFYHSTGGDNWHRNDNWCSDKPLEEWYGISSSLGNSLYYINLDDNNLTGYGALHSSEIETLRCSNNKLTSLDVSGCTALVELDCYDNQLTSLNVSGCTALVELDCYDNQLTSLDVSGCTALQKLDCDKNLLTSLDVSRLTKLEELFCSNNKLTSLNVSECTALVLLMCDKNNLISLNASGLRALDDVVCYDNDQLMSLDVSGCITLGRTWGSINCNSMNLTTLNASGCTSLRQLHIGGMKLTSLDVSNCTALEQLGCSDNKLTSLDVSTCTALERLDCSDNKLTSLDVSTCTELWDLDCYYNELTSLNISGCTALYNLRCSNNQITSLNVSGCTALEVLYCPYNQLTSLDVSGCTALEYLGCDNNKLTSLDVSNCTALRDLECEDNQLTSLDVSRCTELYYLRCRNNKISQVIPKALWKLSNFWYDRRYTNYYRDKDGLLHYTDNIIGWWFPGEPQKGYHGI